MYKFARDINFTNHSVQLYYMMNAELLAWVVKTFGDLSIHNPLATMMLSPQWLMYELVCTM